MNKDKKIENNDLTKVNNEMADFLGEDKSNLPQVVEPIIESEVIEKPDTKMAVIILDKLEKKDEIYIKETINNFMTKLKNNPLDMTLSSDVYKIGNRSAEMALPKVNLYDELIASIMEENQKGPETEGTKDYNLLQLKRELDLINPSVLAKTPIKQKVLIFFNKSSIPGKEKIMDMIYSRKETVKSSIDGIKLALLENANGLDNQLADLMMVYKGLYESHKMLKMEIHISQKLFNEIKSYLDNITDPIAKENIQAVLADLTTQVNSLIVEENMNTQFFAGSQLTAKLVREQQNQIRILVRQMEKSVLANLGLRVVAKGLEQSVKTSKALGNAIATTIADTAKSNEKTADILQKARTEGYINLDKLQEGVDALERSFLKQAQANELIIKQGVTVANKVRETTERLEKKIDKGSNALDKLQENKE